MLKKDINDILSNLLCGNFTEDDNQQLEAWLNSSHENRQRYEELMNSDDLLDKYHLFHSIDKDAAWRRFHSRKKSYFDKLRPWLRTAAILIFVVMGSYWYLSRPTIIPPTLSKEVLSAITQSELNGRNEAILTINGREYVVTNFANTQDNAYETNDGISSVEETFVPSLEDIKGDAMLVTRHDKEFWMTLDDGTRVHLNYNTAFTYPVHFEGKTREVELSGEAFFFVAKDQKRPFIVHTPQGDVRVYGTEFDVKTSSPDREQGTVVLVSGSVGFTPKGGMETVIKPGQEISYDHNNPSSITVRNVDITPYTAWNTGVFVFENSTLQQLMSVLAQWYSIDEVIFEDEKLRNIHFTGSLERYGDITNVIQAITSVCDIEMIRQEKDIVIREKQR